MIRTGIALTLLLSCGCLHAQRDPSSTDKYSYCRLRIEKDTGIESAVVYLSQNGEQVEPVSDTEWRLEKDKKYILKTLSTNKFYKPSKEIFIADWDGIRDIKVSFDVNYYYLPKDFHSTNEVNLGHLPFGELSDLARRLVESRDNRNRLPVLQEILRRTEPITDYKEARETADNAKKMIKNIFMHPEIPVVSGGGGGASQKEDREKETAKSGEAFHIPIYEGMVDCSGSGDYYLSRVSDPFSTRMRVFKTKDGSPLSKKDVFNFYSTFYLERGWTKPLIERKEDGTHLQLEISICDHSSTQASVRVAGDLDLWVAPQDGLLTICMEQWKISSLSQPLIYKCQKIETALESSGKDIGYKIQKGYVHKWGNEIHKNENLVEYKPFSLFPIPTEPNEKKPSLCGLNATYIGVIILGYKDSEAAKIQSDIFKNTAKEKSMEWGFFQREILQRDNILIVLENYKSHQTDNVSQLIQHLEKKLPTSE